MPAFHEATDKRCALETTAIGQLQTSDTAMLEQQCQCEDLAQQQGPSAQPASTIQEPQ